MASALACPGRDKMEKYYTYILRSLKDNKFYVGRTSLNPNDRLKQHNQRCVRSTKSRIPFTLVCFQEFETREKAILREKKFKKSKRKDWPTIIRGVAQLG